MMRRHKSLTTPNKNTKHEQTRRHSSQVIISTNYELRDAELTKPPPPVDSNSSGSDTDNNVDDIKKARRERRRRRSRSRRRRKSLSSVNSKKKLQSNRDDMNPNNCNNDSSIDILNGNHDQVLKDSLLLAKQHLLQPSSSTSSLRRSLSHNEIYNYSTISLLDDIDNIIPTKESNEHTNRMKSNLLACSITTDSSASFVGTENKIHISDDDYEEHSIVSSVDDSVNNIQQEQQDINKEKNNNSSRTLNTSATTTSNPQPSSPNFNQPSKSQPLSQSIIMEEHIALKLNVAQLHTELQTSQIQLNKYTLGLQQATSGLKSAQLAIGKLQSKNKKLVERNEELESENYYLLILMKNLIDEGGDNVGIGKGSSLEEMLAPLKKNKRGVSSSSEKRKGRNSLKECKGKGKGKEEVKGWKKASTWWKDRSNRSSDIDNKDDDNDDEVLVVQGLPLIDNSDRGGAAGCGGGSKASAQSNKSSSYKPGASVRSLKSSNKSSTGSGWWGGNSNKNNRHRRSKSGEVSEGCGSSWHTSAASGKCVREEGTELLDEVPSGLIDKIRNLSVTLSRGSNMAVDSSKQKRSKCQVEGQGEVDDHPPIPEYVQWDDDRKIDYCSDVSFDGIIDDETQQQVDAIGKADEKEEEEKEQEEYKKKDTNLLTYLKKNSGTSQSQQQAPTDTNMEEERQHANSAQYSLNPGDDDTYDPSEYEFSDC